MSEWFIKQNDANIEIQVELLEEDGTTVNVTGATVDFHMRLAKKQGQPVPAVKTSSPATIVDGARGIVSYVVLATDTDIVGRYDVEWQVNYSAGEILTFPTKGYDRISIVEELA